MRFLAAGVMAILSLALIMDSNLAGEKAKHSIKEVMKEAHKGGLMKKVSGGTASDEEKKMLVELYESLAKNAPPKGEAENWKKVTTSLVETAKAAAKGDEKAAKSLPKLANCMGCHSVHK